MEDLLSHESLVPLLSGNWTVLMTLCKSKQIEEVQMTSGNGNKAVLALKLVHGEDILLKDFIQHLKDTVKFAKNSSSINVI